MAIYDEEVASLLGRQATTLILRWVKRGAIDAQKMEDFASLLHLEVGGEHRRRREHMFSGEGEMRSILRYNMILSDWYNKEMFEMDRVAAVKKLAAICR